MLKFAILFFSFLSLPQAPVTASTLSPEEEALVEKVFQSPLRPHREELLAATSLEPSQVDFLHQYILTVSLNLYKLLLSKSAEAGHHVKFDEFKELINNLIKFKTDLKDYIEGRQINIFSFTRAYIDYFMESFVSIAETLKDYDNNNINQQVRLFLKYIKPYDNIQSLLTDKVIKDYFAKVSTSLSNDEVSFQGSISQGWGIIRTLSKEEYGVVRLRTGNYIIAPFIPVSTDSAFREATSLYNYGEANLPRYFCFLNGRLIENDLIKLGFNGNLRIGLIWGKGRQNEFCYDNSRKPAKTVNLLDPILTKLLALIKNPHFPLQGAEHFIYLPLPKEEDTSTLGLLYLEDLIQCAKRDPSEVVENLINLQEEYLRLTGGNEELILPCAFSPEQPTVPLIALKKEHDEQEREILGEIAARLVSEYPEDHPLFKEMEVETEQENNAPSSLQPQESEPLAGATVNAEKAYLAQRAQEKEYLKAENRRKLKQATYWERLASSKHHKTTAEENILTEARHELEHKKTLFRYMTQADINQERKRTGASLSYSSAPHGYVTLDYADGRPSKKIFLSNHLRSDRPSIAAMGAHVRGHKFRNLAHTQGLLNSSPNTEESSAKLVFQGTPSKGKGRKK